MSTVCAGFVYGLAPLELLLTNTDIRVKGTVALATIKVDILDLGKNLAGMMLSAPGFEVINLVSDVPSQSIVEAVRKYKAKILALSMLLTPMVISLRSRMENISKAGLWDQAKFIVGGACTAPGLA